MAINNIQRLFVATNTPAQPEQIGMHRFAVLADQFTTLPADPRQRTALYGQLATQCDQIVPWLQPNAAGVASSGSDPLRLTREQVSILAAIADTTRPDTVTTLAGLLTTATHDQAVSYVQNAADSFRQQAAATTQGA